MESVTTPPAIAMTVGWNSIVRYLGLVAQDPLPIFLNVLERNMESVTTKAVFASVSIHGRERIVLPVESRYLIHRMYVLRVYFNGLLFFVFVLQQ